MDKKKINLIVLLTFFLIIILLAGGYCYVNRDVFNNNVTGNNIVNDD